MVRTWLLMCEHLLADVGCQEHKGNNFKSGGFGRYKCKRVEQPNTKATHLLQRLPEVGGASVAVGVVNEVVMQALQEGILTHEVL